MSRVPGTRWMEPSIPRLGGSPDSSPRKMFEKSPVTGMMCGDGSESILLCTTRVRVNNFYIIKFLLQMHMHQFLVFPLIGNMSPNLCS